MKNLDQLCAEAQRHWASGDYHRDRLAGLAWQPWSLSLGTPSGRELLRDYTQLRTGFAELQRHDAAQFSVEWSSLNHRQLGEQRVPMRICFEHEEGWLDFVGRRRDAARFKRLSDEILTQEPRLRPLLQEKPELVLEYGERWRQLLTVAAWFITHPRPGIYVRQIDLPGIDTKFIERHQTVLTLLLDRLLPPQCIDDGVRGLGRHGFERRYGLRYEEPLVRLRLLDRSIGSCTDLSVPVSEFGKSNWDVRRVFVTENKVNGLAFPAHPDAMVVFGLGYGLETLGAVPWLGQVDMFYWGDIDTHGYTMLARLRRHFPQVRSLLMDEATLDAHWSLRVEESDPVIRADPAPLSASESAAYGKLRLPNGTYARIEQERIGYHWLQEALGRLVAAAVHG